MNMTELKSSINLQSKNIEKIFEKIDELLELVTTKKTDLEIPLSFEINKEKRIITIKYHIWIFKALFEIKRKNTDQSTSDYYSQMNFYKSKLISINFEEKSNDYEQINGINLFIDYCNYSAPFNDIII